MFEYVKWCNSEDLACGRYFSVSLRTLGYLANKLSRISRLFIVKGKHLSNTVFIRVSPTLYLFLNLNGFVLSSRPFRMESTSTGEGR